MLTGHTMRILDAGLKLRRGKRFCFTGKKKPRNRCRTKTRTMRLRCRSTTECWSLSAPHFLLQPAVLAELPVFFYTFRMWFPLRKLYVLCFCVNEVGLCIFIKHTILYYVPCSCIIIISLRFPLPFLKCLPLFGYSPPSAVLVNFPASIANRNG